MQALKQCGLEGREQEYIWQLSGGQTHLLALAGASVSAAGCADPGRAHRAAGSSCTRTGFMRFCGNLNEKYGKTIIVIEHHTEYIAEYCKTCAADERWAYGMEAADRRKRLCRVEELRSPAISFRPR